MRNQNKKQTTRAHVCVTSSFNMASILSLPDECLHMIVSCIDDPSSFYNIALSCKRFQQAAEDTKSFNTNLLKAKAEYYIKCYIIEASGGDTWYVSDTTRMRCEKLTDFLKDSARFTASKELLTYDKVVNAWRRSGPVVANLLTWLRNREGSVENIKTHYCFRTSSEQNRTLALHLPAYGKNMVIKTSYSVDFGGLLLFQSEQKRKQFSIQVTCGDIDVTAKFNLGNKVRIQDCISWEREKLSRDLEPIKVAIQLLQREIGETDSPISNGFFIWLSWFFPNTSNLPEENRLTFKDDARNTKPTLASVQTAVQQYHKFQQSETKLQKLRSGWEGDEDQKSDYSKIIAETVYLLAQRSEAKILGGLRKDARTFHEIATYYDLMQLPKQFLLDLMLRTSLDNSRCASTSITKKCLENRLVFRCLGGQVMKVCGSFQLQGNKVEVEFTLPDGRVLKLESPFEIETLSPVTQVLMEGVRSRDTQEVQGKEHIPEINNFRTAVYFLHALELSEASDFAFNSFDRMIPFSRFPESEEESSPSPPRIYYGYPREEF